MVVTVAADKLLESGPEALEEDGRSIRLRIDELMRVLGAKFPVYVLVTKCDLVQGMTQFCDQLSDKGLDQAMGLINHDFSKDAGAFHDRAIHTIAERLRDLRLLLFHKSESKGVDPSLLLFPEEFERLKVGLNAFIKGAFQENPYQETPILRGLFYSSGRQEGSPYSHFLNALGLIGEREVLPGTNKGLFLHDFFARILPRERTLFAPTLRAIEWSQLTRNLGLASWIAVALAVWAFSLSGFHMGSLVAARFFTGFHGLDPRLVYGTGVVLGAAGAAMDVGIAVISSVEEVRRSSYNTGKSALLRAGRGVGRAVAAPMVLSLFFAYAGISAALLVLVHVRAGQPACLVLNRDDVIAEVLRILAGAGAIALTIPLAAALSASRPGMLSGSSRPRSDAASPAQSGTAQVHESGSGNAGSEGDADG